MYGFAWLSAAAGLASLFFTMHLFQYLGLRVRNSALPDGEKDPQLGRKFVLHVFAHLSVLLILVGVTVSVIDVLDYVFEPNKNRMAGPGRGGFGPGGFNPPPPPRGEWFNEAQRTAAGLLASGFLHFVLFFVILLVATNNASRRLVARSFVLARLVLAGVLSMGATTTFLIVMLQKGDTNYDALKVAIGLGLVWGPTALIHLLLAMGVRDKKKGDRAERDDREPRDRDDRDDRGRDRRGY